MRVLLVLILTATTLGVALANSVALPMSGTTAQSTTLDAVQYPSSRAVDGHLPTFSHTLANDPAPTWQILLDNTVAIDRVVLRGRIQCCSHLDTDLVVEVISGATVASLSSFAAGTGGTVEYSSPVYNPNNVLSYVDTTGGTTMIFQLPAIKQGNFIRVMRRAQIGSVADPGTLALAEVNLVGFQPDLAPVPTSGATAVQSTDYAPAPVTYAATKAIDNNFGTLSHTSGVSDRSPGWQMLLPEEEAIQRVIIWNRRDGCCTERLADIVLELVSGATQASLADFALGSGGTVEYTSAVLNPNNVLLSPLSLDVYLPAAVRANLIRIRRINSNIGGTDFEKSTLALGEVQLFSISKELEFCGSQYGNCALYCIGVGERSGCSGCAATKGTCTWCVDPNNEALGTCVLAGSGSTCGTPNALDTRVSKWTPANDKCPLDFAKEMRLKGTALSQRHNEHSFSFAYDSKFCDFSHEPWFVDKWSGATSLTAYTQLDATPCHTANTRFGKFPGAETKEEFLEIVYNYCPTSENPLATHYGRECMRLMQSAYCSSACPLYGVPASRPCYNWDLLFRVCAPWTNKAERTTYDVAPVNNGCPLDPNNILKAADIEVKCDPNLRLVPASGLWEHTFGLYEPLSEEMEIGSD